MDSVLNIGAAEMIAIGIIVLLAVGPEQLPGMIRKVGQAIGQVRSVTDGFKSDFMAGIEEIEQATDLDKLSEKVLDPFDPDTFEGQSKMSKKSKKVADKDAVKSSSDEELIAGESNDVADNDQPEDEVLDQPQNGPDSEVELKRQAKRNQSAAVVESMHAMGGDLNSAAEDGSGQGVQLNAEQEGDTEKLGKGVESDESSDPYEHGGLG